MNRPENSKGKGREMVNKQIDSCNGFRKRNGIIGKKIPAARFERQYLALSRALMSCEEVRRLLRSTDSHLFGHHLNFLTNVCRLQCRKKRKRTNYHLCESFSLSLSLLLEAEEYGHVSSRINYSSIKVSFFGENSCKHELVLRKERLKLDGFVY